MKQSQVKPGVVAMLALPRKQGAVRVEVVSLQRKGTRVGTSASPDRWLVRDSSGAYHVVSPRQLQPMPAPVVSAPEDRAFMREHFMFVKVG